MRNRTIATALAAVIISSGSAWAILPCADYVSGSGAGGPKSGHLIGEMLVEEEVAAGINAGAHASGTAHRSWNVGYYRMNDGSTLRLDCRTYTVA